jgi:hypothetical protein
VHLKSHRSHDIVLLCLDWSVCHLLLSVPAHLPYRSAARTCNVVQLRYCCRQAPSNQPCCLLSCSHEIAHTSAEVLKRDICEEYGVPLMPDTMPPGAHCDEVCLELLSYGRRLRY